MTKKRESECGCGEPECSVSNEPLLAFFAELRRHGPAPNDAPSSITLSDLENAPALLDAADPPRFELELERRRAAEIQNALDLPSPRYQAVLWVAAQILRGRVLSGAGACGVFTVGPWRAACDASPRFACLDDRGTPAEWAEVHRTATSLFDWDEVAESDWSAFGAASAFVTLVGVDAVAAMLVDDNCSGIVK